MLPRGVSTAEYDHLMVTYSVRSILRLESPRTNEHNKERMAKAPTRAFMKSKYSKFLNERDGNGRESAGFQPHRAVMCNACPLSSLRHACQCPCTPGWLQDRPSRTGDAHKALFRSRQRFAGDQVTAGRALV